MKTRAAIAMMTTLVLGLTAACSSPSSGGGTKQTSGPSSASSAGESAAQKAAREMGIDLSKCPTDITKPLTGTIKVGTTLALTGPVAPALVPLAVGEKAAIAYLNETSGLPIKFALTVKDDQFSPDKTLTATQELVQSDKVDFLDGTLGTANVAAVRPLTQKYCVPLIAGDAGGTSVNQPSKFPFTTIWGAPFYLDVKGWFTYLKEKFPKGGKIAVLTSNTDSGQNYLSAINSLSAGTNFKIVSRTTLDATVTQAPSSQVTTMKASGAKILLAQTAPSGQCSSLIKEVAQQGWKPDAFMITNSCSTLQLITPAGRAAQNLLCNLWLNDPSAPGAANDPGLQKIVAAIKKFAPGTTLSGSNISGYAVIEVLYKAAEQAKNSPLGLSRLGILYAATHMTFPTSTLQPGLIYSLNYPSDQVNIEADSLHSYDAATKGWKLLRLYDFNGQLTGKASS